MKFVRPLQDVVATEKEKVALDCELSRPNVDVRWLKVPADSSAPLLPLTRDGQVSDHSAGQCQPLTRPYPFTGQCGAAGKQDHGHGGPGGLQESRHLPM